MPLGVAEDRAIETVIDVLDRIDRQDAHAEDKSTVLVSALGAATGRRPLRRDGTVISDQQAKEAAARLNAWNENGATEAPGTEK